jgi:hypothetical protein
MKTIERIPRRKPRSIDYEPLVVGGIPDGRLGNRTFITASEARRAAIEEANRLNRSIYPGHSVKRSNAHRAGELPHYHVINHQGNQISGHFFYGRKPYRIEPGKNRKAQLLEASEMNQKSQWLFENPVVSKVTYHSNPLFELESSDRGCVQNCDTVGRSDPACKWGGSGDTRTLPLSGCCRSGFIHNCYSEAFIPNSASPLNICVCANYNSLPPSSIAGREDFSVQLYRCRTLYKDQLIGVKRVSRSLPDALKFSIASVKPGDKYYINIYSGSHQMLDADFQIWQ